MKPAKRINKALVLRLVGTLLAVVLLAILLSQQGWHEIGQAIRQIPWWRFALSLALVLISRLAITGRWHVLLRNADLDISLGDTTRLTFAGLFASNFLPTTIGGDVVRLAGALQLKFDGAICTASLVADRLVGMAGMVMAVPFGIPSLLSGKFFEAVFRPQLGYSTAVMVTFSSIEWLRRLVEKGLRFVKDILQTLSGWIKRPASLLKALLFSWLHMICLFLSITVLLDGMQAHISFWLIAGLYSVVYFITLVPISINGYGVQELSMALIFSSVGGISRQSGLTIALLIRTLTMLASLPGAIFTPGIMSGKTTLKDGSEPQQVTE